MSSIERILSLIEQHNITAALLLRETKLNHGSISQWKKGMSKPSYGALVKISNYFNVSVEYLECKTDNPTHATPSPKPTVNDVINLRGKDEAELLEAFNKLDTKGKHKVLGYVYGQVEVAEGRKLRAGPQKKGKRNNATENNGETDG